MKVSTSLLARAIAYALAIGYLSLDLFVFHGPLYQRMRRGHLAQTTGPHAVAARIFGADVTMREVDQAMLVGTLRSGRSVDFAKLPPHLLFDHRIIALGTLLDQRALDAKLTVNPEFARAPEGADPLAEAASRAGGPAELDALLAAACMTRPQLRDALLAEAARLRYLEARIAASDANAVTDESADAWLEAHRQHLHLPARLKLRHIFLPTLHRNPDEVKATLATVHHELLAGTRSFAESAAAISEDEASKDQGGLLGWVAGPDPRLPAGLDFSQLLAAPIGIPLPPMRTELGWHLFLVDEAVPARPIDPANARAEVRAFLASEQRREVKDRILTALRAEGDCTIFTTALRTTPCTLN